MASFKTRLPDTLSLLLGDPQRPPRFPFEREVRLFEFQTWIYFPRSMSMVRTAGRLAAAKFLEQIAVGLRSRGLGKKKPGLKRLLRDPDYWALYKNVIGRYGGWTKLMDRSVSEFDNQTYNRQEDSETVCTMIDYRFRYLDHGGTDLRQKNISHSAYYRYKAGPSLTWRTINARWGQNKESAVALYVSEKLEFRFFPLDLDAKKFTDRLTKEANDTGHITKYLAMCKYVADVLQIPAPLPLPETLEPIRPMTAPLTPSELEWMVNYRAEIATIRSS